MTELFVVIIEDKHCDTDAEVFRTEAAAVTYAVNQVPESYDPIEDVAERDAELTEGMKRDGWVLYLPYSCEGDNVRVVKRELR